MHIILPGFICCRINASSESTTTETITVETSSSITAETTTRNNYSKPMAVNQDNQNGAIPKADIRLIVFDMGHVFVDFEWEDVCQGFCERAGISREEFAPVLKHIGSLGYENGHIDTAKFLAALNEHVSSHGKAEPIEHHEFQRLWNATFRENLEMAELMQDLKKRYTLYLLSNTNESHWHYLNDNFSVSRHFEQLILSYEIGHSKPHHQIYHEVLRRSDMPAEQCLFIDDLPQNIQAGAEVGMNVIHFQGVSDLKASLKNYGVQFAD
jgi:HAD superfamily hydrolase (TIGR01509 family)